MRNASRYYVLVDGSVTKDGTFDFTLWDWDAARELLTAIVRTMCPNDELNVEAPLGEEK